MIKEVVVPAEGPNGCALSPDGKTLFYAETPTGRVWACELAGPGQVARRRCLGNVPGAMVAGLLLGMIEILSAAYIGTTERDFFSFAILILILIYRPTGLFGTRTTEER